MSSDREETELSDFHRPHGGEAQAQARQDAAEGNRHDDGHQHGRRRLKCCRVCAKCKNVDICNPFTLKGVPNFNEK